MALHANTQRFTEVEDLGVGHPQFSRQLIHADVLRHGGFVVLLVGGVLLVRGSTPESKGSIGGSAPAEPPSDAIGWRGRSPVRLSRVEGDPTASHHRVEMVGSRWPTKSPSWIADPQSFQTGVCGVHPGPGRGPVSYTHLTLPTKA